MKIQLAPNGRCIAIGIDAQPWPYTAPAFINPDNFNRWVCNNTADIMNPASWTESEPPADPMLPIEVISRDSKFGKQFAQEVINQIKNIGGLSVANRLTLANKIHGFFTLLLIGDIEAARAAMNSYTTDTLLTVARKTWVLQQLDNYLNS